eukprot:TRINITY_DN15723_c0_g1_i1.p1 TRINITY_DN15723_c0_g1~~TRINITY_DN15723_c0_g1_i1.p1  ORF type:complete len:1228 (+),score=249.20 TRINITY_DN15723_c0_g1_i1:40-3723(+)
MYSTTRFFSRRSVRWAALKSTKWETHEIENRVTLDKEAISRYSRARSKNDRLERYPQMGSADVTVPFEEDFGTTGHKLESRTHVEANEKHTSESSSSASSYNSMKEDRDQKLRQQQSEEEDEFVAENLTQSAQSKFVDSEIMKMESRVLKAAARKEAAISMHAVTNPLTSIFNFNGRLVPPPPNITNILVPSAVSMGHDVFVKQKFSLVYEGGPYDTYLDNGPNAASEVAFFGAQGCGKTALINAITEQNVGADSNRRGETATIGFYQCKDEKLWKDAWSEGPTKYPASTRLSKTHWGGMLVDLPGYKSNALRPDSTDIWYQTVNQYFEGTRRQLKGTFYCISALQGLTHSDKKWLSIVGDLATRVSLCTIVITKADAVEHATLCNLMKKIYTVISGEKYRQRINLPIVVTSSLYGWGIEDLRGYITLQSELLPWWKRVEEQKAFIESLKADATRSKYELSYARRLAITESFRNIDNWNTQAYEAINTAEYGDIEKSREAEHALVALEKKIPEMGINIPGMGARHNTLVKNRYVHGREPGLAPTTLEGYVAEEELKKTTFDSIVEAESETQLEKYRNQATAYPSLQQEYQKEFVTRTLGEHGDARKGVSSFEPSFYSDPDITKDDWDNMTMQQTHEVLTRKGDSLTEKMNYGFTLDDIRNDVKQPTESEDQPEPAEKETENINTIIDTTAVDVPQTVDEEQVAGSEIAESADDGSSIIDTTVVDVPQIIQSAEDTVWEPMDMHLPPRGIASFTGFVLRVDLNAGQLGRVQTNTTPTTKPIDSEDQPCLESDIDIDLINGVLKMTDAIKKGSKQHIPDHNPDHSPDHTSDSHFEDEVTPIQEQEPDKSMWGDSASFTPKETMAIASQVLRLKGGVEGIQTPEKETSGVEETLDAAAEAGFGLPKPEGVGENSPQGRWNEFTKLLNAVPGDVLLAAQPVDKKKTVFKKQFAPKRYGRALQLDDQLGRNNEPVELSTELIEKEVKSRQMGPHYMGFPWMSHEQIPTAIAVHNSRKAVELATASSKIHQKSVFSAQKLSEIGSSGVRDIGQRAQARHKRDYMNEVIEEHHHKGKRRTRTFEEGIDIDTNVKRFKELQNGVIKGPKTYSFKKVKYGETQGLNSRRIDQALERLVRRGKIDKMEAAGAQERYTGSPRWKKNLSAAESVRLGFSYFGAYNPLDVSINAKGKVKLTPMGKGVQMARKEARSAYFAQKASTPKVRARIVGARQTQS